MKTKKEIIVVIGNGLCLLMLAWIVVGFPLIVISVGFGWFGFPKCIEGSIGTVTFQGLFRDYNYEYSYCSKWLTK